MARIKTSYQYDDYLRQLVSEKKLGERQTLTTRKDRFRNELNKWRFSLNAYQVLEVLFRQCLMKQMPDLKYANDSIDERLFGPNLSPQARLAICDERRNLWNQRLKALNCDFGFEYGFENLMHGALFAPFYADDEFNAIAEIYASARRRFELTGTSSIRGADFRSNFLASETENFRAFTSALHERFNEFKRKNSFEHRASSFGRTNEGQKLKIQANKFFPNYIGIADGVFGPYFAKLSALKVRSKQQFGRNTNTSAFIAAKLNFEFGWHSPWKPYRPRTIHDRLKGNAGGYEQRRNLPFEMNLVNDAFIKFLFAAESTHHGEAA